MKEKNHLYLSIAKGLQFPIDAVTQKIAFIGRSGSGKTYGAGKLAEEFLANQVQLVILDPVGVWNGLRTSKDGKGKGFPIPVFGGEHGDIALLPSSGALIAGLIVEKGISAVLDVSYMRKNERKQFVTDLSEQLFYLKKKSRSAMHIIVEEAQVFVPQRVIKGEERMLGAMEDLIKLGRNYGIGVSLISQRPQSVHKDCLNQTEALFAFQINGPHERKAIEEWVVDKGLSRSTVAEDLSGLEVGSCFLWSPQWLRMLEKIKILPKKTFDASETPKVGNSVSKSRTLAPVDLDKIAKEMESVIKEKKENDPAELKKEIAALKKKLGKQPSPIIDSTSRGEIVILKKEIAEKDKLIKALNEKISFTINKLQTVIGRIDTIDIDALSEREEIKKAPIKNSGYSFQEKVKIYKDSELGKCERAILTVLAQRGKPSSKTKIAILSGYSSKSGGFNNSLSKLRSLSFIEGTGENIVITSSGILGVGEYEPLPEGEKLHEYWYSKLPKAEATILKCLIENHPSAISKENIAAYTGYSQSSGGFNNALSKLRTLELIEGRGEIKASDSLFE